tara:strand:+ start:221 stop:688 length:468 start_codon:yes stop_codon:yes gene_type:complete
MAYDTKKLFRNAISNVAKDFGSLYSEGEEVPRRRRNEGDVEIDLPPSRLPFPDTRDTEKTKQGEKSLKKQIKEAFLEAGSEDYMRAYQKTLETLNAAQRNRPRFANAKIYMGQGKLAMARGSTFGAIAEADPEKLLKENRTRMKDFVISKAYLKA